MVARGVQSQGARPARQVICSSRSREMSPGTMVSGHGSDDRSRIRRVISGPGPVVSVEAASTFGWQRYTGTTGLNIGIDSFGASAPAGDLFAHFGFTAQGF